MEQRTPIYFDNAATTKVCPEAAEKMLQVMTEDFGNPSSQHFMGRNAKKILEEARGQVADSLGAKPEEVFFTSGGTEADNWAIRSGAWSKRREGKHIISSVAEHDAVLKSLKLMEQEGFEVTYLIPDKTGRITVESVAEALREDTVLVTLMLVNNETGAINDIPGVAKLLKSRRSGALLHTDAVQGFLKIPFSAKTLGADMISISSHKIHGPKGSGALYIKSGTKIGPLLAGGGQEEGYRSGTEGLPGIAGFGVAAMFGKERFEASQESMKQVKAYIIKELKSGNPETIVIEENTAPHVLSVFLPGYRSEPVLNYLDSKNICISSGSACTRGKQSHVYKAMGLPKKVAEGAIRLSFSGETTMEEAEILCREIKNAQRELCKSL